MARNSNIRFNRGFGSSQLVSKQSLFDQHWAEMFSQLEENAKLLQELRNSKDQGQGVIGSGARDERRVLSSEPRIDRGILGLGTRDLGQGILGSGMKNERRILNSRSKDKDSGKEQAPRSQGCVDFYGEFQPPHSFGGVRSFGTEGRKKDGVQIPANDKIYEYILFRGSDIKDLQVKSSSPPVQTAFVHNDPAIIQSHYSHPASTSATLPSAGNGVVSAPSSNTTQLGLSRSALQGGLPLHRPGGSIGSWGGENDYESDDNLEDDDVETHQSEIKKPVYVKDDFFDTLSSSTLDRNSTQISSSKETQRRCSTKCLSEPLRSTKNLQGSLRRSWGNWNRSPKVDVDLSPTSESRKKKTKKPQSSRLHRFPTPDARKKKTKKLQYSRLHRKPKLKKPPWPTLSKRKPKLKNPPWLISSKKKKKPNKKPPVSNVSAMASNTILAMAGNGAKRIIRGLRSLALILKFPPNFVRHLSNKARRNCGNIGIAQVAAASGANSPSDEESLPSACKEHALQKELIGQGTEKLDLQGKVVVPGFIDSHVHLIAGGLQMGRAELRDVKRQEDFVQKVKEDVRDKTPGEWVLGHGWNNDIWGALPGASWIDGITHDNPVWLSRRDGHMGVANSLALKIAGITNITKDPVGGSILRTMDGEPTGLLADSAMKLVLDVIPEVSVSERRNALLKASKYALMKGVTTVVDVGRYIPGTPVDHPWQDLSDVYMWANSTGKMLIRVCLFFPMQSWSRLAEFREKKGSSLSQWIYLGGVKAFADGSLGSNSALFHEPYEDDPHNYGLRVTDFDWLLNATLASDRSGLQVAIHAIGDKANDVVLDLFDTVASSNGVRDRRFRVEHAQHLMPGSIIRFGQQGVIASVQPDHLLDDAGSAEKKIGIARAQKGSYLFQSLLAGKAHLSFGSDWPVADINPLRSIQTAITRVPPGWETAWIPTERVGLLDALNAHTTSAAYACFLDHELGSLSPGKYADFIVLDATSWNEFAEQDVTRRTVEATYVSGVLAYP